MLEVERLYVVVRDDMPVGLMTAQAIHAARMWRQEQEPTVVVFRSSPEKFSMLLEMIDTTNTCVWKEPDQKFAPTAICSPYLKDLAKKLKLSMM